MKLYCHENKIFDESGALRCFLSYDEALAFSDKQVLVFDAVMTNVFVYEGAFETIDDETFNESRVTLDKYRIGSYLKPICFAAPDEYDFTPTSGEIGIKFFEDSDKFYVECLFQKLKEKYPNFELYAVRSCFETLTKAGKMKKTEENDLVIFEDLQTGEIIPLCKKYLN